MISMDEDQKILFSISFAVMIFGLFGLIIIVNWPENIADAAVACAFLFNVGLTIMIGIICYSVLNRLDKNNCS